MKSRVLLVLAFLCLPMLTWADPTDPQIDPNNCTGSFSITLLTSGVITHLDPITNTQVTTFAPLITAGGNEPDRCIANTTGSTINSLMVTGALVPNTTAADYSCPPSPLFAGCSITLDPTLNLVTYDFFGGPGVAAGAEFGFTELGFGDPSAPTPPQFSLTMPEPSTWAFLAALPVVGLMRRRKVA
ncbi:MAG: hypothetical protein JOZ44_01730 [Acidobacteria bacterium]|nr:hypothetical protein [Acidobacteriota bacterium]